LGMICRMLRGHTGEKLPHGRQTYQDVFSSLTRHDPTKRGVIFSRLAGVQFGWNILERSDLRAFDCCLPRSAGDDPHYAEYERNQERVFHEGRPSRFAQMQRRTMYRPLVPLEQGFNVVDLPTSTGRWRGRISPNEVILVTAACDRYLFDTNVYSADWPFRIPKHSIYNTKDVSQWLVNILLHSFSTGENEDGSKRYAGRDTGGWVRLDELYEATRREDISKKAGHRLVVNYANRFQDQFAAWQTAFCA